MTTITRERAQEIFLGNGPEPTASEQRELARIALASLEREQVRREHAEWSDKTFGDVGPVGPLKHLSKEALEAAAEPDDLSEWADMQFLLWDAQRRAGISDGKIIAAMVDKLKVNKQREWPEPKDGEPRLHIKEQPAPVVPEEMPKGLAGQIVSLLAHNIGDKFLAQKIWNACRNAMLQGVEQLQNARQNIPENIPDGNSPVIPEDLRRATMLQGKFRDLSQPVGPQVAEYEQIMLQAGNSPVTPDGWISCSERMPDDKQYVWFFGESRGFAGRDTFEGYYDWSRNKWWAVTDIGEEPASKVTHWMPLPEPPQQ
ncbi:TPA: dATP/dGTP pyrophosphohydrolase domain-containing protein [Salmonella enterica subsp. enterica serovar Bahrenfeld]|nr:DUF550 domain-containing protein [Salmonella enterica subsp. enterica serovar Bahrenfeld]HDN5853893.1 DUF550 domain-containing protein [Salmonella enterica subsp. enterica serovar Bahrenfeld]